jgi:hypothetical protein
MKVGHICSGYDNVVNYLKEGHGLRAFQNDVHRAGSCPNNEDEENHMLRKFVIH